MSLIATSSMPRKNERQHFRDGFERLPVTGVDSAATTQARMELGDDSSSTPSNSPKRSLARHSMTSSSGMSSSRHVGEVPATEAHAGHVDGDATNDTTLPDHSNIMRRAMNANTAGAVIGRNEGFSSNAHIASRLAVHQQHTARTIQVRATSRRNGGGVSSGYGQRSDPVLAATLLRGSGSGYGQRADMQLAAEMKAKRLAKVERDDVWSTVVR